MHIKLIYLITKRKWNKSWHKNYAKSNDYINQVIKQEKSAFEELETTASKKMHKMLKILEGVSSVQWIVSTKSMLKMEEKQQKKYFHHQITTKGHPNQTNIPNIEHMLSKFSLRNKKFQYNKQY